MSAETAQAARRSRAAADDPTRQPPRRIVIQYPTPSVDGGRYAVKRCVGDRVRVEADVFRDGHDLIRAVVRYQGPEDSSWQESELRRLDAHLGGVRWVGGFDLDRTGRWQYTIEAWTDVFGTWRDELRRKVEAGQHDLSGELSEGVLLLRAAADRAPSAEGRRLIEHAAAQLGDPAVPSSAKHDVALGEELLGAVEAGHERHGLVRLDHAQTIEVDRLRARFSSWYELFPRSWGGLSGVERQLPKLAELGFDVIYLPPIHPIGLTNRKGRNNALRAGPGDPGSPWAIGDAGGGHDAIHPDLGTEDDLRSLTAAARALDIDIALDFAIQCSADHPWLTQHPEWFHHRPDGTLKYAENPPKRYQDIYNVNWESPEWRSLWDALLEVVLKWVDCGVRVFRVDNPHTKPFAFWAWLIEEVHGRHPDVLFLAEAFTKRAVMRHLGKLGFSQSYTYFTWKNARWELVEYVSELAHSGEQDYFRPNFFTNTPDILHEYLQHGGRPAFEARAVLAATLSPSYGIYSGYENFENVAVAPGSEEYVNSEKYEVKTRTLDGPLLPLLATLNHVRREHPALQSLSNITFLDTANEALIAYAKQTGSDTVLCVVNLDPHQRQEGVAVVPASLGLPPTFSVRDHLSGEQFQWHIGANFVGLSPGWRQAHLLTVER
ncbi:MAG TPA: alpha-1,4-glucan--maltose-1-phosphate maltosyltransferase [Solirubrobacteraceae bacterium]